MATLLQDDFNRANSTTSLGSPNVGGPYAVQTGVWGINNNEAYMATPSAGAQVTFPAAINLDISAKNAVTSATQVGTGLMIRWIDVNNFWLFTRFSNTHHCLYRCIAGVFTQVAPEVPVVLGDVIGLKAYGDQIGWLVNGKQYGVITDQWAVQATATAGVRNSGTATARWDDLIAQDQFAPLNTWGGAAVMAPIEPVVLDGLYTLTPSLYKGRDTALADESEFPLMALIYTEFDSTIATLTADLRAAILTSSDWSKINSNPTIQVTSAIGSPAATALTFVSATGFSIGQSVKVGTGAIAEYKTITATSATTITFTGQPLIGTHAVGTTVTALSEILKATTTRGAEMIVDLSESHVNMTALVMAVWKAHDGTTGVDKSPRWLYYRTSAAAAVSNVVHCIVSASKEHLFISLEGPRANETGATSTTVGSIRNFFFMDDLVPYHAADTNPVVFAGGGMFASASASMANNSFQGNLSRNITNVASWTWAKLLTLDFPSLTSGTETIQVSRYATADGKYYLAPFVCFGDESGLRGRLRSFFHVGYNSSDTPDIAPPPVGQKVTYAGQSYRLLAVNKSDGSTSTWGQFGSANNTTIATAFRSSVVAVPCTP